MSIASVGIRASVRRRLAPEWPKDLIDISTRWAFTAPQAGYEYKFTPLSPVWPYEQDRGWLTESIVSPPSYGPSITLIGTQDWWVPYRGKTIEYYVYASSGRPTVIATFNTVPANVINIGQRTSPHTFIQKITIPINCTGVSIKISGYGIPPSHSWTCIGFIGIRLAPL